MISSDFVSRRLRLFDLIRESSAQLVIHGRSPPPRSPDVPGDFYPYSPLLYLTGYSRAGGALTIEKRYGNLFSTLFLPPPDRDAELWTGLRTPFAEAKLLSGVDSVRPESELTDWLEQAAKSSHPVYASVPPERERQPKYFALDPYIDLVRFIKSTKEIAYIKKACAITESALASLRQTIKAGDTEKQIAARFNHFAAEKGATGLAYPIVAASGKNALCLHYIENRGVLKEGDCLMVDAGAEFQNYASDYTRTFPIGNVSKTHLALIQMVDDTKSELVQKVKSGEFRNLMDMHLGAARKLQEGLRPFGIRADERTITRFYPHFVSHWIGLDVHDSDTVPVTRKLEPGCVFSVEPGLYFQLDDPDVPPELKGLGCRFEDTVILE